MANSHKQNSRANAKVANQGKTGRDTRAHTHDNSDDTLQGPVNDQIESTASRVANSHANAEDDDSDRDSELNEEDTLLAMEYFSRRARWIPRGVAIFLKLSKMIQVKEIQHKRQQQSQLSKAELRAEKDFAAIFKERHMIRFEAVLNYLLDVAGLHSEAGRYLDGIRNGSTKKKNGFAKMIAKAAYAARADDSRALKYDIIPLIPQDTNVALQPMLPMTRGSGKATRGFNHPFVFDLLMPPVLAIKYKDNPIKKERFRIAVVSNKRIIDEKYFPAFVYDMEKYSPGHTKPGLFYGYLPIRVARFLLTGPSSATDIMKSKATRTGNAGLHGVSTVTPEMIAYVCVQTYFSLSTSQSWDIMANFFNLENFYYDILKMFNGTHPVWEKKVIKWWQKQLLPHTASAAELAEERNEGTAFDFQNSDDEEEEEQGSGDEYCSEIDEPEDDRTSNADVGAETIDNVHEAPDIPSHESQKRGRESGDEELVSDEENEHQRKRMMLQSQTEIDSQSQATFGSAQKNKFAVGW